MSSIVDPPPDSKKSVRRLIGRIARRSGARPMVDSPEDIAAMLLALDGDA